MPTPEFWTALAAVATLAAVLVALAPPIAAWFRRPKLKVVAELKAPACQMQWIQDDIGPGSAGGQAYYLRLWIENTGRRPAENVQVFLEQLSLKNDHGAFAPIMDYLPMNLRWSHSPGTTFLERINPQMGRHCELGSVMDPSHRGHPSHLTLATEVTIQTVTQLQRGRYRLRLKVAGSNAAPVTTTIEMFFSGQYEQPHAMFELRVV